MRVTQAVNEIADFRDVQNMPCMDPQAMRFLPIGPHWISANTQVKTVSRSASEILVKTPSGTYAR
jgi:hypothetical protein